MGKNSSVNSRISAELAQQLHNRAEAEGVSKSVIIERALARYLTTEPDGIGRRVSQLEQDVTDAQHILESISNWANNVDAQLAKLSTKPARQDRKKGFRA